MEIAEYKNMFDIERTNWWFCARRAFVAQVFNRVGIKRGTGRSIVDIGAGTGGMIQFLSRYGNVVGIEPSPEGRAHAKKRNIFLHRGFAHKTGFPSDSFDVVCFFDVLYHLGIDEVAALREARRLLTRGGMLLISDCAMPFLHSPHDIHVMGRTRYTRESLTNLVGTSGFSVKYASYTFFLLFPLVAAWRLIRKVLWRMTERLPMSSDVVAIPGWLNSLFLFICSFEVNGYGRVSYPWGSSLILVATK